MNEKPDRDRSRSIREALDAVMSYENEILGEFDWKTWTDGRRRSRMSAG